MAIQYLLDECGMTLQPSIPETHSGQQVIRTLTHAEFDESGTVGIDRPIVLESIRRALACHVDVYDDCSAGGISIPDKTALMATFSKIGFYFDENQLTFIDDSDTCAKTLERIAEAHHRTPLSLGRVLFLMLERLIDNDALFLETFEARLEESEESIVHQKKLEIDNTILLRLRELLRLNYYYEQLEDIGGLLEENANELLDPSDARLFGIFARHADRLFDRTRTLKEYSLQLLELQQTQIDIEQNHTMQWLTVVTSIFVPITMITSWYGMNFKNMPELDWSLGYPLVIFVCAAVIIGELVYFKHRKWL